MQRIWFNKAFSSVAAAIRLIREADVSADYYLVCSHTHANFPAFLAAHQTFVEPSGLTGKAYLAWCLDFCQKMQIDIFIPGKEAALISGAHAQFAAQGVRVLSVAAPDILAFLHDKAQFCQAVDLPLAPPADFRVIENIAEFDAAYLELRTQHAVLCIKPAESVYGLGFSVIDENRSSAQILLDGTPYTIGFADLRRGLAEMQTFRTMLLMEYLDGHEYSVDCVANYGELVCAVPRKKSLLAGHGQTIELHDAILQSTRKLAADYGLNGIFNVQFREGKNGLGLLEINPRMSGGIAMACLAGPNLPYIALRGFDCGFEDLAIPDIRAGLCVTELGVATELSCA